MEESIIYSRLSKIFNEVFDEESITLTPDLSAKDVAGWDSLAHIRLIATVEKEFKVRFPGSQLSKVENVGNLVALIRSRA